MHSLVPWFMVSVAGATDWVGSDLGGADLALADGDTVTGTFTGVGRLEVPFGAVVFARDLEVEAVEIVIDGTLTADGAGEPGGEDADGAGPGAGLSGGGGGGGGGYGGAGGAGTRPDGTPAGAGGPTYGDPTAPGMLRGSGGGGSGTDAPGGAGGGALVLRASARVDLGGTGRVSADGLPGDIGCFGGGGGSGGAITLEAPQLDLFGVLSARGGDGASPGECYFWGALGGAGGGGGGGRIRTGTVSGGVVVDVAGGVGGDAGWHVGEPGSAGTWVEDDAPIGTPDPTGCAEGDDSDADGVCDADDVCVGADDSDDADQDGYCALDVLGNPSDCDDTDPETFPGAPELCDGVDNACVGRPPADEQDLDGDTVPMCGGDCDDLDPLRGPAATEVCNGVDDDCDGAVDPGCPTDADTGAAGGPSAEGGCGCGAPLGSRPGPRGVVLGLAAAIAALALRRARAQARRTG